MADFLRTLPNTFIPLFVAIDIFWLLPIFVSFTGEMERAGTRRIIRQSLATAFAAGLVFASLGEFIFRQLGITVNDFKVAGGLLLLVLAIVDLTGSEHKGRPAPSDTAGVVPIGVPLIVGPAVLTTILVLVEHYGMLFTMLSLVLNLALVGAAFLGARRILGFLGKGGIGALSKIMAILLASIAVMMIRLGMEGILAG